MINLRLLIVFVVFNFSLLWGGIVVAQDTDTPPAVEGSDPEQGQGTEADEPVTEDTFSAATEEIIVTGSRIRRDAFTAALPVTVITAERALLAGLASTSEMLQSSALASGTQIDNSFGGFVVSGGPGVNTFGLRSLDPGRTLVLINGRRFTPAGTRGQVSSVDLNSIPNVAIERIEILKDGASSIYGADAVAGVVNIITKKRYDAFVVEGYYQDEIDVGSASMLYGKTWDRGFIDVAVEFSKFGPVGRDEQDYGFCDERPLTNGSVHPSIFAPTRDGRCFGAVNGFVDIYGFGPVLTAVRDPNADFLGTGLPWRNANPVGPDGLRLIEEGLRDDRNWGEEHIIPERELFQVYSDGQLDFDLGDLLGTVSGGYEFYYSQRDDKFNGGYRQFFPFIVHPANPTNPFGQFGGYSQPVVMAYDMLDPVTEIKNDVASIRIGLEGNLGEFAWNLDAGYSWSRGEFTYDTWLKDKVARSLSSAIGPDGNLQCVLDPNQLYSAANFEDAVLERIFSEGPDPNCVPLDLFSEDAQRGTIPQDAADYISERVELETDYDLWTVTFNVEGRLFDLPAGEVRAVAGMDWRSRNLDDRPPLASVQDNQWGYTAAGRTKGDDTVTEGFTEVEIPLLSGFKMGDISVAEELTVNGSYRYTHYSSYGSDSTWRLLFNYAVNPVLRVRSTVGTSFRAPALYELNLANQTGFVTSRADPCDNFRDPSRDLDPGSNVFKNCEALEMQGIIPPDYSASSSILVTSGGNPDLNAETSDSWTLGFVVTPDLAGLFPSLGIDLSVAFDYYDIDLENSISQLSASSILSRCYSSANFTAQECALVGGRRVGDGQLKGVNSSYINVAVERSAGYDITVRADREFTFGDLSVDILAARLLAYEFGLGDGDATNYAGRHAYASWRGEMDARFDWRDYTFTWTTDYIGSTDEEPIYDLYNDGTVTNVVDAGDKFFHSVSFRYRDPNRRFEVIVGVRNIFDEEPAVVGWGPFNPAVATGVNYNIPLGAGYDLLDRRVFASLSYNIASLF